MEGRLRQISDLERLWAENGVTIRKCLLQISRDEQTQRFRSRLLTPGKKWKVKEADFTDRNLWSQFQAAYEKILSSTSTVDAPWYIVPADRKWYRDVAIAGVVLSAFDESNDTRTGDRPQAVSSVSCSLVAIS
jgi:polyphosphate kinase 2 (PPK2 family)